MHDFVQVPVKPDLLADEDWAPKVVSVDDLVLALLEAFLDCDRPLAVKDLTTCIGLQLHRHLSKEVESMLDLPPFGVSLVTEVPGPICNPGHVKGLQAKRVVGNPLLVVKDDHVLLIVFQKSRQGLGFEEAADRP